MNKVGPLPVLIVFAAAGLVRAATTATPSRPDVIVAMNEHGVRIIPFEKVWAAELDPDPKATRPKVTTRFRGEREVTAAIAVLNLPSPPQVAFVRSGGPPLIDPGMPLVGRPGPMNAVATALREDGLDVSEMSIDDAAGLEKVAKAVWIALIAPAGADAPAAEVTAMRRKVAAHLDAGGSAMLLLTPQADPMNDVLKPWGIEARTDAVAVHQVGPAARKNRDDDGAPDSARFPFVFDLRDYGDHPITRPLRARASMLLPIVPVRRLEPAPAGVNVLPILPIPPDPKSWGETNVDALNKDMDARFDEGKDIAPPIFGGVVAARARGGRLVVIGSAAFAFDQFVNMPDPALLRRGVLVPRYPANAELFGNAVTWLVRMESLLQIPATSIAQDEKAAATSRPAVHPALHPESLAIIKAAASPLRLISLYRTADPADKIPFADMVDDLLGQYKIAGGDHVTVDAIDPTRDPARFEELLAQLKSRYGVDLKNHP